jgi:hypothetical protein
MVTGREQISRALKQIQDTQEDYRVVMHIANDVSGLAQSILDLAGTQGIAILNLLPEDREIWQEQIKTWL